MEPAAAAASLLQQQPDEFAPLPMLRGGRRRSLLLTAIFAACSCLFFCLQAVLTFIEKLSNNELIWDNLKEMLEVYLAKREQNRTIQNGETCCRL